MFDRRLFPLVLLVACGCSFTRPQGDGGWSRERRNEEIRQALVIPEVAVEAVPDVAPAPTGALDLDSVLRLVGERNQRIAESERQVEAAAARVGDVRGRLLPALTGGARYTWYSDTQSTSVKFPPQLLEQFQLQSSPAVRIREAEAGMVNGSLVLPVDLSGELRHALRAAQAGYRGEQARLWAVTLDQQTAAVRAYLQMLEAQRLVEVVQQSIAQRRQQLTQTQGRFDNGRVTKNELLVVQVALRDSEQQLSQRQLMVNQSRWVLNQLIGRDIDAATTVVDVVASPQIPAADELVQAMQQQNPLAVSLLEEQQRYEETVTALERSRLPRFFGGGAVDYNSMDIVQPQQIESGYVGMTWDLGTDLRRESQITEARASAERNRASLKRLLQELETAVRSAHGAALDRLGALQTAQSAVEQAAENLRIREQQFDVGRIESDKVLEAGSLLNLQRAIAATALYQAHIQRAELQQLIGLPLNDLLTGMR